MAVENESKKSGPPEEGAKTASAAAPPSGGGGGGGDRAPFADPKAKRADRLAPFAAAGLVVSLVLLYAGQRIFAGRETVSLVLSALGVLGAGASVALRLLAALGAKGERRSVELTLARFGLVVLGALALYFASTDAGRELFGIASASPETRARIDAALLVAWVSLLALGLLPSLFGEISLAPMREAERVEVRRVRAATGAGLALGLAVLYVSFFVYGAGELDVKADFSYFRTARPGESTKNIAKSLSEPVKVQAFFPPLNEVGIEAMGYLEDLARESPQITVERLDRVAAPAAAKQAKVTSDGVIVVTRADLRETISLGTEKKMAAAKLKTLDAEFQKALLKVLRSARTAYLTVGHGELNDPGDKPAPPGRTVKVLRRVLETQNYAIKDLGVAQGLAGEVPEAASVVLVLGPSQPFLPEEVAALERYAARGGKLLLALDPEAKVDLAPLAAAVGVVWKPGILANDKVHMSRRQPTPADTRILLTNRFSSHASVSTLSRNSARAGVIFPGASSLDKGEGPKVDFTIRSLPDTFVDENDNFTFDEGAETRGVQNLAAAVTRPAEAKADKAQKGATDDEMRAFVLSDADAISDAALANDANLVLFADALRWLGGEESFAGEIASTEDVRIEHTKEKDLVWFYGVIFGAPSLVLGAGLLVSRRARGRRRGES